MENIQEKLKYLTNFAQKVSAMEFEGKTYFVGQSGSLDGDEGAGMDLYLFDENGKHIGNLYLSLLHMDEAEREWERRCGVLVAPARFYMLTDIEILRQDLHGKHLGSFLLNLAMHKMEQSSVEKGENIPLLFLRQNSKETIPFYQMWGAEINQSVPNDKIGSSCHMIIPEPKHKACFDGKLIARFEKSEKKEDKHK